MMKHKITIAVYCAIIVYALTSCQLAKENASADAYEDRLIGVFVTSEYLDLFDFEAYFNNNIKGFRGGELVVDGETEKYQGRLYANLVSRTLTSEETGEAIEIKEYIFKDIAGIPYFSPTMQDEHGNHISTMSDGAVSDGHMDIKYSDDVKSMNLTGTIYAVPASMGVYYMNPVYQSRDGSVYLSTGSGVSISGAHGEGERMTQTLENSCTVTENGKTETDNFSITLSVSTMFAPETVIIYQMDANAAFLSRLEYIPGTMPDSFEPEAKTNFLVVETRKRDYDGAQRITRDIYNRDNDSIETFYARADGVCVKHWTRIGWQ